MGNQSYVVKDLQTPFNENFIGVSTFLFMLAKGATIYLLATRQLYNMLSRQPLNTTLVCPEATALKPLF